jgi:hypothetical protein
MYRSLIGAFVGASCGFAIGYYIACWATLSGYREPQDGPALILAGTLCGMAALTGAVVGGVGDIIAFLHRLRPNLPRTGREAAY